MNCWSFIFFFKQKTAYEMRISDWSSDVCSSDLSEEVFRHAMEQAEAATRSKSEFLANISHDLRTPLNAILGLSEMILREVSGPFENETYRGARPSRCSGHYRA